MPKFKQLIENYLLGYECSYSLKDLAYLGLKEGLESPSLTILAGLEKGESSSVVDYYLQQALTELNIQIPNPKMHALDYTISLVDDICAGHEDILEGTKKIIHILQSGHFNINNELYAFDDIGFEKIYGLYYSCDDIADATWLTAKTKEKSMDDMKAEMVHEYKIWRTKLLKHKLSFT